MTNDVASILLTEAEIKEKIKSLGEIITNDYKDVNSILIIGVLKGSFVFMADLIRQIKIPCEIDFMSVSSYKDSTSSSGEVKIQKDITINVAKKNILFVEDIIDTGFTMSKIKEMFFERGANSIKLCALLNKPDRRNTSVTIDYKGFDIPDEFVIGYGLDYADRYRNLPYIGILNPKVYE